MQNELPKDMQRRINCYKPIETEGFVLYPARVKNYYEFGVARQAIAFVQQTLSIEYMSLPLLSAFYKMDYESIKDGGKGAGLFAAALLGIALALRLNQDDEPIAMTLKRFQTFVDPEDQSRLKCVRFVLNGEEEKLLTPIQYARFRPIIAAQNGIELASNLDNPELLQAEADLAEARAPKLEYNINNLVTAAALFTGKEEEEIYEWPILKMTNRLSSVKRILDYTICGIGESQGTTWKKGNPSPHPWLDRAKEGSESLIPMASFANGQGIQAMQNAGALQ